MPREIPEITVRANVGDMRLRRAVPCGRCHQPIDIDVGRYGVYVSRPSYGGGDAPSFFYYHVGCISWQDDGHDA
jgi:hypothetical protein